MQAASGRVVASAEKVSFCVRDSIRFGLRAAGLAAPPLYGELHRSDHDQGFVGGVVRLLRLDYLPGQELDIRGLPGRPVLPADWSAIRANRLEESNEDNNERSTLVRIRGRRSPTCGRTAVRRCDASQVRSGPRP